MKIRGKPQALPGLECNWRTQYYCIVHCTVKLYSSSSEIVTLRTQSELTHILADTFQKKAKWNCNSWLVI